VRQAYLSTMPDCTEELSEIYYFIADRLDASLAAAHAANLASLENSLREQKKELEEASRQLRRRKTIQTLRVAARYAIIPFLFLKVASRGGFLPPDEQWWFSSIMTQFGLYLILFALQLWFQVIVMDTYVLTKIVEKVPILRKLVILMQDHPILKYVLVSIMYFFALPDRKIR
jgi:hypothetical protein